MTSVLSLTTHLTKRERSKNNQDIDPSPHPPTHKQVSSLTSKVRKTIFCLSSFTQSLNCKCRHIYSVLGDLRSGCRGNVCLSIVFEERQSWLTVFESTIMKNSLKIWFELVRCREVHGWSDFPTYEHYWVVYSPCDWQHLMFDEFRNVTLHTEVNSADLN